MAWGYWSATAVDRGRSPRRNTQCTAMPINTMPQAEPPIPTAGRGHYRSETNCSSGNYSPCRSRCSSPCHSPCPDSPCPCPDGIATPPPPPLPQSCGSDEYLRRSSLDRLDSPQVNWTMHRFQHLDETKNGWIYEVFYESQRLRWMKSLDFYRNGSIRSSLFRVSSKSH